MITLLFHKFGFINFLCETADPKLKVKIVKLLGHDLKKKCLRIHEILSQIKNERNYEIIFELEYY